MDSVLGLGLGLFLRGDHQRAKISSFTTPQQRDSPTKFTFSLGHAGASRKSPNDAPYEMLNHKIQQASFYKFRTLVRTKDTDKNLAN